MHPQMYYQLLMPTYPETERAARRRWLERELQLQRRAERRAADGWRLRRGRRTPAPSVPSIA